MYLLFFHSVHQLRAAVADLPKPEDDDYFYLRWLRARKFNVKKSEEMLRKARQNFEHEQPSSFTKALHV